jgi:hypothetical protein
VGGVGEPTGTEGAWTGVDVVGALGVDADADVDASSDAWPSFSSFFLRPNMVSIPNDSNSNRRTQHELFLDRNDVTLVNNHWKQHRGFIHC